MRRGTKWISEWRPLIGVAAVAVLLGGCSSVPDAVNPVKWYENTVDLFSDSDDEADRAAANAQPAPGADKDFPSLGTVPEKPAVSSRTQREQVAEGLVADRENRRYAPAVERQGAPANVLSNEQAPTPVTRPQPPAMAAAPAPVPSLPVANEPVEAPKPAPAPAATPSTAPQPMASSAPPAPRVSMEPPAMPNTGMQAQAPAPVPAPAPSATAVSPRMTQPVPPANAMMPSTGAPYETVVVSSSGVDVGDAGVTQMTPMKATPSTAPQFAAAPPTMGSAEASGSLRVATIQFATGSATLDSRDRTILKQVVALQRERGGVLRIVGHASARTANMDAVRHKMVNYEVSAERAQTVAQTLMQFGAPAERVTVVAKSDTEPVFYEFMPSGEAGNRRTEIYLDF